MYQKIKITRYAAYLSIAAVMVFSACQKFDRPVLKELVLDPEPPPHNELKSLFAFENNLTDEGEDKFAPVSKNVTYVAGISGQAAKIGDGGYILIKGSGDTVTYPNGYRSISADTLRNLGSFTISFWLNSVGPVKDGAQGVFAFSNKNEFWGNLEVFLENNPAGPANEAYIKIHLFNASVASGNGEEWNETKLTNALNKWTHLAITYNAATSGLSLYMDGQTTAINNKVLGGGNYGKLKFKDFNGLVLGSYAFQTDPSLTNHGPESWARSLNGALDQFRIYNRAFTAAEITDLFNTKK